MKHPLGLVVVFYTAGLLLAEFWQPPLKILFGISFALALGAILISRLRPWLLWPLMVLTGWTILVSRTAVISPHDIRTAFHTNAEIVVARVVLRETPRERTTIRDGVTNVHCMAQADVLAVQRGTNDWEPIYGRIMVFTHGPAPTNIYSGQRVEIEGVLSPPPLPVAEGLFNYQKYLKRQGIYFQLRASSAEAWSAVPPVRSSPPLSDRFLAWARATLIRGMPVVDEPLNLLLAMTLGWQAEITNEIYEPFMQSGTMHIFAISGLHIAMIAGILVALLRVARVPRFWSGMVVIPLMWFYTAATGWQPSAIRSSIMMTVVVGGWALNRPGNLLNSLGVAAFIILVWDPQQLFQASFQLSFFVVLSIALLMPSLEKFRDQFLATDPLIPVDLIPKWRRRLRVPLREVLSAMSTSVAAWLGSWLLTAYYFHLFSPVTLLANLAIVPVSSAALASNLGSLLFGAWFPWASVLFNHSAWFFMSIMIWLSHRAIELPAAYLHVAAPTLPDFAIYFALLFGVLSGWVFARKRRLWVALGLVGVCAFYIWRWHMTQITVQITAIPLNGGSCVFINAPGRTNDLLVDCGDTDAVNSITRPYLWAQGVNRLSHLLLTHGDVRHIGGANFLRAAIPAGKVETSPVPSRSEYYREIVADLQQHPDIWRMVSEGDHVANWSVLHPRSADRFPRGDDNAVVLRGEYYGTRVLLLSDLGGPGQRALMQRHADLRADILIAGPATKEFAEPLSDALLDLIQPRLVIITDSEIPATKRASTGLHERLERRQIPVLYTRQTRAVTVTLRKTGWVARGMDGTTISVATDNN